MKDEGLGVFKPDPWASCASEVGGGAGLSLVPLLTGRCIPRALHSSLEPFIHVTLSLSDQESPVLSEFQARTAQEMSAFHPRTCCGLEIINGGEVGTWILELPHQQKVNR